MNEALQELCDCTRSPSVARRAKTASKLRGSSDPSEFSYLDAVKISASRMVPVRSICYSEIEIEIEDAQESNEPLVSFDINFIRTPRNYFSFVLRLKISRFQTFYSTKKFYFTTQFLITQVLILYSIKHIFRITCILNYANFTQRILIPREILYIISNFLGSLSQRY